MRSLLRLNPLRWIRVFRFSTIKLVPKKDYLPPESERGFMFKLFHKAKLSPAYPILCELFEYLQATANSGQFQLIESNPKYLTNFMFIHLVMISNRLKDSPISGNEVIYLLQTYFYIPFAERVQKSIPVKDFGRHFIDIYAHKFEVFQGKMGAMEANISPDMPLNKKLDEIQKCFRIILYENKIKLDDPELVKVAKYYEAHKLYLNSLEWKQLSEYAIRWGFVKAPQQIQ